jgi:hypothetical protein
MKKFRLTMMCSSCKWKISDELKSKGFIDFDIDMDSSILTFQNNVLSSYVMSIVNNIGYQIEELDALDDLTDEELAILEYEMKNQL